MGENLYLYLAISNIAVSSALIREEENVQKLTIPAGIPRSRGQLPKDGKDSFHIIGRFQETLSLLPSALHHRHDKPTNKQDDEQVRCSRTTHSMGN